MLSPSPLPAALASYFIMWLFSMAFGPIFVMVWYHLLLGLP